MKNFIKRSSFLLLIIFSLVFISCESGEDTLLVEEQNKEQDDLQSIDPADLEPIDIYEYLGITNDGRALPTISLKGNNGRYISSENGNKAMTCNRTQIGPWEKFKLERTIQNFNQYVYVLKANNGKYARIGFYSRVYATGNDDRYATPLVFYRGPSSDQVYVREGADYPLFPGNYLSSENGSHPIRWNRSQALSWETFTLVVH